MPVNSNHPPHPVVYNKAMTTGGTEYSQALPRGTQKFSIMLTDKTVAFQVGYVAGGPYVTVPANQSYSEDGIGGAEPITLYFKSATAAMTAEIIAWS